MSEATDVYLMSLKEYRFRLGTIRYDGYHGYHGYHPWVPSMGTMGTVGVKSSILCLAVIRNGAMVS